MLSIQDEQERDKAIRALEEAEKAALAELHTQYNALKDSLDEARELSKAFGISVKDALSLLTLRELRYIHFHFDSQS